MKKALLATITFVVAGCAAGAVYFCAWAGLGIAMHVPIGPCGPASILAAIYLYGGALGIPGATIGVGIGAAKSVLHRFS